MAEASADSRWHFVIQTDERGIPAQDYGYVLTEAIAWSTWRYGAPRYDVTLTHQWPDDGVADGDRIVPVGSLEWVESWLQQRFDSVLPRPIYIPAALRTPAYLQRDIRLVAGPLPRQPQPVFIKEATRYKAMDPQVTDRSDQLPVGEYWLADVVEFQTEWRAFVHRGALVGLQNYGGDFTRMPDVPMVRRMIGAYTDAPAAYTLDVGVLDTGATAVVEVHPFVSCGLYGFEDVVRLPSMLIGGWQFLLVSTS